MSKGALGGRIIKCGGYIRCAWLFVGIVILILLIVEAGSSILLFARDTIKFSLLGKSRIAEEMQYITNADAYHNADWVEDYYLEHNAYARSSIRWRPYVIWGSEKFEGKYINVDENGIRKTWNKNISPPPRSGGASTPVKGEEVVAQPHGKPQGVENFKIFMFGGSTTWGYGIRDEFTIPSHLSRILSEQGFNVEIVNFGEIGYVSTQEVIKLLLEIHNGNIPDVAVFYDGVNDVAAAWQNQGRGKGGLPQNMKNREIEFNLLKPWKKKKLTNVFMTNIAKNSSTYRLTKYLSMKIPGRNKSLYDVKKVNLSPEEKEITEETVKTYSMNVQLLEKVGEQVGFDTLFYWQPIVFTKPELTPYEQSWDDRSRHFKPIYKGIYELVEKSDELNSNERFHNISRILEDYEKPLYIDNVHISEEGNEIVAQRMAQDLSRILEERSRAN